MYLSTCKEETMYFSDLNDIYITSLLTTSGIIVEERWGK